MPIPTPTASVLRGTAAGTLSLPRVFTRNARAATSILQGTPSASVPMGETGAGATQGLSGAAGQPALTVPAPPPLRTPPPPPPPPKPKTPSTHGPASGGRGPAPGTATGAEKQSPTKPPVPPKPSALPQIVWARTRGPKHQGVITTPPVLQHVEYWTTPKPPIAPKSQKVKDFGKVGAAATDTQPQSGPETTTPLPAQPTPTAGAVQQPAPPPPSPVPPIQAVTPPPPPPSVPPPQAVTPPPAPHAPFAFVPFVPPPQPATQPLPAPQPAQAITLPPVLPEAVRFDLRLGLMVDTGSHSKIYRDTKSRLHLIKVANGQDRVSLERLMDERVVHDRLYGPGSAKVMTIDGVHYMQMLKVEGTPLEKMSASDQKRHIGKVNDAIRRMHSTGMLPYDMHMGSFIYDRSTNGMFLVGVLACENSLELQETELAINQLNAHLGSSARVTITPSSHPSGAELSWYVAGAAAEPEPVAPSQPASTDLPGSAAAVDQGGAAAPTPPQAVVPDWSTQGAKPKGSQAPTAPVPLATRSQVLGPRRGTPPPQE